MASNKNAQNSAPGDLKRTNCTINLSLVFPFWYIWLAENH